MARLDPRGPIRTIATVTPSSSATFVTYEECDHAGHMNRTMTYKVGSRLRCFSCGREEKIEDLKAQVAHLQSEIRHLVNG